MYLYPNVKVNTVAGKKDKVFEAGNDMVIINYNAKMDLPVYMK